MLSLQNILNTEGREFLENLLNKEVVVTEKLNAATLSMKKKQSSEMDMNRTLTDEEVMEVFNNIIKEVETKLNIKLRSI
jgi:hypothetical protein